ncbi:hypothetical protein [Vibrio phage VP4B]|uniref:Uncharacterized protein n=1 Tax=Vibrio phage VP4B TaxID=1262540 RepID=V9LZ86_9CAUD|nr:hypothetical protein FDJ61_gp063 [Vibrio phage VP4B]AGB07177.1 hypothetical protein [Vibrio phage VP4B]
MPKCKFDLKATNPTNANEVRINRGKMGELFYVTRSLVDAEGWVTQLMNKVVHNYQRRNGTASIKPDVSLLTLPPMAYSDKGIEYLVVGDRLPTDVSLNNRFEVRVAYVPANNRPYQLEFTAPSFLFPEIALDYDKEYVTVKFTFAAQPDQADIKRTINDYLGYFPYNADQAYEEFCGLVRAELRKPQFNWFGKSGKYVVNMTGTRHHNVTYYAVRRKLRKDEIYAECLLRTLMVPSTTIIVK